MIHLIRRMSRLSLNELWFIIIAILFVGFFVLEGFDFGVGILVSRFLGENDFREKDLLKLQLAHFGMRMKYGCLWQVALCLRHSPHW